MENIAFSAEQHQVALLRVNVSLPLELIQELLDLIEQLKDASKVRQAGDGKYSVLDFIGNVVEKLSPREVWRRLLLEYPSLSHFCDGVKLPRSDGKKANVETPVTTELGIIYIALHLPGELGSRLRYASSILVIETLGAYKNNLNALLNETSEPPKPPFPYTLKQLHEWSGYKHFWYTKQVLKEDYKPGADYITIENKIYISLDTAYIFLFVARPENGTTIPEEIRKHLCPWDKFQEVVGKRKKINRRRSQSKESPGVQLELL